MESAENGSVTGRLLFLFLDGVGLGAPDAATNPFSAARTPFLHDLLGGRLTEDLLPVDGQVLFRSLDATLGLPGLPQSATGQATLLTGSNGAERMGRHYGPWPGPTINRLLEQGTIFSEARASGRVVTFANAYPPGYFAALESGRARANVPVRAAQAAGVHLRDLGDYASGTGLAADLTGEHFASLDASLPTFTPGEAGARLARLALRSDLTFFDCWLTDRVGHRGTFDEAVGLVERLDEFISGVVADLEDTTLLVTSDHGNLENKGTRGHTRAPVPLIALGPARGEFASCHSLTGVADGVRRALRLERPG